MSRRRAGFFTVVVLASYGCDQSQPTAASLKPPLVAHEVAAGKGIAGGKKCREVQVTPAAATVAVGGIVTLTGVALNKKGNVVSAVIQWSSRSVAIAAVSSQGLVTGVAGGSVYVVGTCAGTTAADSALITVTP